MDLSWGWLLAGGTAITGIVAMAWRYLLAMFQYVRGLLLINVTVRGYQMEAMTYLLSQQNRHNRFSSRFFFAMPVFVQPRKRDELVVFEDISHVTQFYWVNGWPILISENKSHQSNGDSAFAAGFDNNSYRGMTMQYIRGTIDINKLMLDAIGALNSLKRSGGEKNSRYKIAHCFGTAGKPATNQRSSNNDVAEWKLSTRRGNREDLYSLIPIGWKIEELGSEASRKRDSLDRMALSPEISGIVNNVKDWHAQESWHQDRRIPWRMGVLLHGKPGTGKTSLIRAIGEDLDLPIFSFDLSTFFNDELQLEWDRLRVESPCIAVIEDIDTVFHGRENQTVHDQQRLSFDRLLNCLDGLDNHDGVLLFITTNHLEHVDPAIANRPGRIDHCVEMPTHPWTQTDAKSSPQTF